MGSYLNYVPGHAYRDWSIQLLLQYLMDDPCAKCTLRKKCRSWDPKFQERTTDLKNRYPLAISSPWAFVVAAVETAKQQEWPEGLAAHMQSEGGLPLGELIAYHTALTTLAQDSGLIWGWAPEALHDMLKLGHLRKVKSFMQSGGTFSTEVDPRLSKAQAQKAILHSFDDWWKDMEREWGQEDGLMKFRKRSLLPKHIRWTYKKHCRRATWNTIAECEASATGDKETEDTIRKAVRHIQGLLKS